jgi:demethylmenaquinone methyltransferase/2-methoxy-6-polyprenyl-1,4-benzoquinol methylase
MTEGMLVEGRKRAEAEKLAEKLDWVVGDAMALPFEDNSFDVYTISFGIRNVTRPEEALARRSACCARRAADGAGIQPAAQRRAAEGLYDLYSFNVIPRMGQVIAGTATVTNTSSNRSAASPIRRRFAA